MILIFGDLNHWNGFVKLAIKTDEPDILSVIESPPWELNPDLAPCCQIGSTTLGSKQGFKPPSGLWGAITQITTYHTPFHTIFVIERHPFIQPPLGINWTQYLSHHPKNIQSS